MADQLTRDGVRVDLPTPNERELFAKWLEQNKVNEPFHPDQHYDYVGAFRAGVGRAAGDEGHFTDQFKLPGHETFSNESQYAVGPAAKVAGSWDGDKYVAPAQKYQPDDKAFAQTVLQLFNAIAAPKK